MHRWNAVVCAASFLFGVSLAPATGQETPQKSPLSKLKVINARAVPANERIEFQRVIEVEVEGLAEYLNDPTNRLTSLILYLDNRPLPGLMARRVSVDGNDKNKLQFDLVRIAADDKVEQAVRDSNHSGWDAILGRPRAWPGYSRPARVTVGLLGQPFDSSANSVDMTIVPKLWGWVGFVGVGAITLLLLVLAWKSDVLRDGGPPVQCQVDGKPVLVNGHPTCARKPFSLARVQLAIWFWGVLASYVFIWVMNGESGSLTGQVLGILGISTLTLVGSVAMDARNADKRQDSLVQTGAAIAQKQKDLATLDAKLPAAPDLEKPALSVEKTQTENAIADLESQIQSTTTTNPKQRVAESFLEDILSDSNGVSFHRFQMFAWTLVVVVVFLEHVWQTLAMPQLNEYLLTLMGMSSGTYVGLKAAEVNGSSKNA